MGIKGLIPFIESASRPIHISEFKGCTVAIDSYCWLHKGAFGCADKLVRGEETDLYIKYCLKYVNMLLANNVKPIMVFDGRHLPAKALTELKRRESRDISKKRAAELLKLGKMDEARTFMRRSIDITHDMALALIKECRKRNVDCVVAPYEADAQLAYLNIKNIAHIVITEDSDLILFGCTKVLFKMDLAGRGSLVETAKLPLAMKCPIEQYDFDKFRQMCIMSGCDYLESLPGIGLAKARQFVNATKDSNFVNALRQLPNFFNRSTLVVTDEYRQNFLKAEATFKHQYVYDPVLRRMVRLTEYDEEDVDETLLVNAGELLDPETAFQLALGNLDPFTLRVMDTWHPDSRNMQENIKTGNSKEAISPHPSIWSSGYLQLAIGELPWRKETKPQVTLPAPLTRKRKVVNAVPKYVPETEDQSLSIETLSNMYCLEAKSDMEACDSSLSETDAVEQTPAQTNTTIPRSPILENRKRSFQKAMLTKKPALKGLSKFPRTVLDEKCVTSKFFSDNVNVGDSSKTSVKIDESPERVNRNPFKITSPPCEDVEPDSGITEPSEIVDCALDNSQKENNESAILDSCIDKSSDILTFDLTEECAEVCAGRLDLSQDSVIENTYPVEELLTPNDSQPLSQTSLKLQTRTFWSSSQTDRLGKYSKGADSGGKKSCKVPGLKRTTSLPNNQPTLLAMFGFQKKPVLKR